MTAEAGRNSTPNPKWQVIRESMAPVQSRCTLRFRQFAPVFFTSFGDGFRDRTRFGARGKGPLVEILVGRFDFVPIPSHIECQGSGFQRDLFFTAGLDVPERVENDVERGINESLKHSMRPLIRAGTPSWDRAFTGYHVDYGFECATLRMDLVEGAERRYACLILLQWKYNPG